MKNKKGFTLVELLAVIVILAIILVIAVPQIMKTIEQARKSSFESSAKMVAAAAEREYTVAQTLEQNLTEWETGEKSCMNTTWAGLVDNDYADCRVKIVNGTAQVSLGGKNKFKGYVVREATKTEADSEFDEDGSGYLGPTIVTQLTTKVGTGGLSLTSDNNYRYQGIAPDNYVTFNNETWRIIGIFDEGVKIINGNSIGDYAWDSSDSTINNGYGINEWSQADLMTELNTLYLNSQSGTCYNGNNNATTSCDFTETGLNAVARKMINNNAVWYTGTSNMIVEGSNNKSSIKTLDAYTSEHNSENNGKQCTSSSYCNDEVDRTTTWTGAVGLMSTSDYGYASTTCVGTTELYYYINCVSDNWLRVETLNQWTISPAAYQSGASSVWYALTGGRANYDTTGNNQKAVRPAVFLKNSVHITEGTGTSSDPYKIDL